MECTGTITAISRDVGSNHMLLTIQINDVPLQELVPLKDMEKLSITIGKYRNKRSIDANAYCWAIMSKMSKILNSSKDEVYEEMLQRYGYFYEDDNGYITITVKASVDMSKISGHWKFYKDNGKFKSYLMIKGSSEYDSAEMSHFIDCIIQEAEELGIETATPDEVLKMKEIWGKNYARKD